ncbi:SIMPL domain-containing protein [Aestuariimicrobium soli]|uniref:SIMPL domain-containing protein n=1 Tax=Aestuariimicrobium soli TaxID=2035834 RepID=UPI003EBCB87A
MTAITITVRGEFVAHRQPERATVSVSVALEGSDPSSVFRGVAASGERLLASIRALHNPTAGPVTWFSTGRVRTWANRPWNKDGKQLALVHHAGQKVSAKFSDFDALSAWLAQAVEIKGVTVDDIDWALTEKARLELVREVRAQAVRQARDKAQEYADALELGSVRVVQIADSGMLDQGLQPQMAQAMAYSRGAAGGGGSNLQLVPEDVSVEASVDARFQIGD